MFKNSSLQFVVCRRAKTAQHTLDLSDKAVKGEIPWQPRGECPQGVLQYLIKECCNAREAALGVNLRGWFCFIH